MGNNKHMQKGMSADSTERTLVPGEMARVSGKHTLVFCFDEGDVSYLNFDESVNEETAKELIKKLSSLLKIVIGWISSRILKHKLNTDWLSVSGYEKLRLLMLFAR